MAYYTKASYAASAKYKAEKVKRIPLDVQKDFYDEIKAAADAAGEPVNTFVKKAIAERIEREALKTPSD